MKTYQIGRKNSPIIVRDTTKQVSRRHAELTISDKNVLYLVDTNSQNGTFIKRNGQWAPLRQGQVTPSDEVRLGAHAVVTVAEMLRQAAVADVAAPLTMRAARN
jgi:pSer/pThr/pTyr-binding forkhead associated (FHA) protein